MPNTATRRRVPMWMLRWGLRAWSLLGAAGLLLLAAFVLLMLVMRSLLKNGRAKAIRFSTLNALCRELGCQPGDILEYIPDESEDN